jgi:hypothetical protein
MRKIGVYSYSSGDMVTCKIKNYRISGRIYFNDNYEANRFWICHDNPECAGDRSPNRFEYEFSWTFYVGENGDTHDDVSELAPAISGISLKQEVSIDDNLRCFINIVPNYNLLSLFNAKPGIFDDYVNYYTSNVEGNIIIETKPRDIFKAKKVEIKLSRFIRQITNKIADKSTNFVNLSDKEVEDIYNKFVSYQNGSIAQIEYLVGENITEGYNSDNYLMGNSTLHKSCMSNLFEAMGIYTKNPEQVKLAVIKFDGKIGARSLVWKTIDGGVYHDRIYYAQDWMKSLMQSILNRNGITHIKNENFKVVQLKEWKFKQNPYIDNFYNLDGKTGQLIYIGGELKTLRGAGHIINWD